MIPRSVKTSQPPGATTFQKPAASNDYAGYERGEILYADDLNLSLMERPLRSEAVLLTGDATMTGPLYLWRDPGIWNEAATKQYVDQRVSGVSGAYLPISGGTMIGPLILNNDPVQQLEAATKRYVDTQVLAGPFLKLTGGNMTGPIVLAGNATAALNPVTLQQLNATISGLPSVPSSLPPSGPAGGDLTGTYPNPLINNVNSNIGTFQGITVNAKGQVTAATTISYLTANQSITLSGDVTGSGTTAITATLANTAVTPGVYTNTNLTVDAKGRITAAANGTGGGATLAISDTPPASPQPGAMWWDSVGGQLFVRFQDADSTQWVIANSGPIAADAPSDSKTYARRNATWTDVSTSVAAAPTNVGRNLIHNALFAVQQRGTGPWTTGGYTADRYTVYVVLDTFNASLTAIPDASRSQIGDESAKTQFTIAVTGNAGATSQTAVSHGIENVRRLSGKTVTVSFYAAGNASLKLGVSLDQVFGTGGSPSPVASGTGQSVTISGTTWARYSLTFAVPSTSGKTFGTNNDDWTWLNFWFSCGANNATRSGSIGVQSGTFYLWGIQLEIGSVPTPLEKIEYADDLRHCMRFFQSWNPPPLRGTRGSATTAAVGRMGMALPVPMRAVPTPVIVSALPVWDGNTTNTWTTVNNNFSTPSVVEIDGNCSSTWAAFSNPSVVLVYQGAGGVLTLSADL